MGRTLGRKVQTGPTEIDGNTGRLIRADQPVDTKRSFGEQALYYGGVAGLGFFAVNAVATAALCVGGIVLLTIVTGRTK